MNSIINHWYTEKEEISFTADNQILGNRLKICRRFNTFDEKHIKSETILNI